MITKIALIVSILLEFIAAITAIRLTKVTKYNISWILISLGLLIMAINLLFQLIPVLYERIPIDMNIIYTWMGFVSALFFMVALFFIRKIFNFISRAEQNRRNAEKQILQAIIKTEERERKRFAKDLHDGLGPLLSTVKLSISSLKMLDTDATRKEIIENTANVINESIKSIKEISNNLSPHILNNFGLASAINEFSNKIDGSHLSINFESNVFEKRFDENIEVIAYRVTCELINNTIKHAKATNVDITLTLQSKTILLTYSDNGIGFDASKIIDSQNISQGMGYTNMISRIKSIKGKIDVDSSQNNGTRIIISIPLSK